MIVLARVPLLAIASMMVLIGAIPTLALVMPAAYAQLIPGVKNSSATAPSTKTAGAANSSSVVVRAGPFQGQSIKVFNVGGFADKQWSLIDNLTSHGYEIKAVLTRTDLKGPIWTVIVESRK